MNSRYLNWYLLLTRKKKLCSLFPPQGKILVPPYCIIRIILTHHLVHKPICAAWTLFGFYKKILVPAPHEKQIFGPPSLILKKC